MPVVDGLSPVMSDARDGPQSGAWQWALANKTPSAASRSMLGVMALGCPFIHPSQSFKSSMQIIKTLGRSESSCLFLHPVRLTVPKNNRANNIIFILMIFYLFYFWMAL